MTKEEWTVYLITYILWIVILICLCTCSGCLSRIPPSNSQVWYEDYQRIHSEVYIPDINDCEHKTTEFLELHGGYYVSITTVYGYHAVNYIEPYVVDTTWGRVMYCESLEEFIKRAPWGKVRELRRIIK